MPQNCERALISSLLRDRDFGTTMAAGVTPEMFHAYEDEFDFITNYYRKYKKLPTKLAFKKQFPKFGLVPVNDTPFYCDEVIENHTRHRLTSSMRDVAELIASGDLKEAMKAAHGDILGIMAEVSGAGNTSLTDDWQKIFDETEERQKRVKLGGLAGISTGFESLDENTGGMQGGQFWVPAARLAQAKTWTMLRMAATALLDGKTVGFMSQEMTSSEVSYRMHSLLSSKVGATLFSNLALQQGSEELDMKAYKAFLINLKKTIKGKFIIDDGRRSRVGVLSMAAMCEKDEPDIIFGDYIQLFEGAAGGEWQGITEVTANLKQCAKEYDIPIVCASQMNRGGESEGGPAGTDKLANSDSIGRDADIVISQKKLSESVIVMRCAKNRHGRSDFKWYTDFRPALGIFDEISYEDAMDRKDIDDEADDVGYVSSPRKSKLLKRTT